MSTRESDSRFGGAFSGPVLEVTAPLAQLRDLIVRMEAIPSLPWMRGSIVLRARPTSDQTPDKSLALSSDCVKSNLMTVLGVAASLGMISGRGVRRPTQRTTYNDRFRA
ncbi:MAG: hypothetical protein AAFR93_16470 [Pseudomonadota bacterium]